MSDEEFVENLLYPLVENEDIRDKDGNEYHLDKSRVSRLLNHRDDIPEALRKPFEKIGVEERISSDFEVFCETCLNISEKEQILKKIKTALIDDANISDKEKEQLFCGEFVSVLLKLFIHSLKQDNRQSPPDSITIWTNGNNYIQIVPGDIFGFGFDKRNKKNRIVVIPVDTSFETQITIDTETVREPLVSTESLHGEFLQRIYKKGISQSELKTRILTNLEIDTNDLPTEVGRIASLYFEPATFFLIAISSFNENKNARSNKQYIKKAIDDLIDYYDSKGQGYKIYVPLMGTGLSRAFLSNQESYNLIKNTLLGSKDKLQGKIHIVIKPEVISELTL